MCGIAGYISQTDVDQAVLVAMLESLHHRGPESRGYYNSGPYNAGMCRLKINDLKGGDQPLTNEDKTVILFYNGEIYNSPELRNILTKKGHRFKTRCDGEVLCHLYEEEGEELFEELDGMFAVALWSVNEKKLILARDIPGEKPLYYSRLNNADLVFASELKSLVKFPGLDLSLSPQAIWDFLTFLWIPEPETVYCHIKALPRSSLLIADSEGIRVRSYNNNFHRAPIELNDSAVIEETRHVVECAVHSRLLSDVPVGCFLSSGLDSSIVATLASKALTELTTFCIAFEDVADPYHGKADESEYAKWYAQQLGTKHHTINVTANDFRNNLQTFCKYADQPFAVSSGLGILSIAEAAHNAGIKVLLSGDGADEAFGGYSWYYYLRQPANLNEPQKVTNSIPISFQNVGMSREERLNVLYKYPANKRAWAWHYYAEEEEKAALFNMDFFESVSSSLRHFDSFKTTHNWSEEDFIRQDREFYFPNEMLRKVDRFTMAHSVEGRVPFAAPIVLSHAAKLSYHHLVRDGELKWVLRRAFEDLLPSDVVRRPKHGFNVPIDHWLRGEWSDLVEEALVPSSALGKLGLIHDNTRTFAQEMLGSDERLNGHSIFCLIMLNLWLEQTTNGNHR